MTLFVLNTYIVFDETFISMLQINQLDMHLDSDLVTLLPTGREATFIVM